jgi:hypothetical protein
MVLDRRSFCQLSAGTLLAATSHALLSESASPVITDADGRITVEIGRNRWEYVASSDTFTLFDSRKRSIVCGKLQPAVVVAPVEDPKSRRCTPGKAKRAYATQDRAVVEYEGVNNGGSLVVTWKFDQHGIWLLPVGYRSASPEEIVSLHYFCEVQGGEPAPALHATYLVVPGISEGSSVSPIVRDDVHLNLRPCGSSRWGSVPEPLPRVQQHSH